MEHAKTAGGDQRLRCELTGKAEKWREGKAFKEFMRSERRTK